MIRPPPAPKGPPARLLSTALAANAAFSGATGLAAALAAPAVAGALGTVPAWVVGGLGAGLVLFAALVAVEARRRRPAMVKAIVAADIGWVLGSVLIVAVGGRWLSGGGNRLVLGLALVVALLAAMQTAGLRSASAGSRGTLDVELRVDAHPAAVWRVVGDRWGDVHELLPRLESSRLIDASRPGVGVSRECRLAEPVMGMRQVRERLVAWEPPRSFTYELLRPPFPIARLRNEWRVEADGAGTRLTLSPAIELRGGAASRWLRGAVLASLLRELEKDMEEMRVRVERAAAAEPDAPETR